METAQFNLAFDLPWSSSVRRSMTQTSEQHCNWTDLFSSGSERNHHDASQLHGDEDMKRY